MRNRTFSCLNSFMTDLTLHFQCTIKWSKWNIPLYIDGVIRWINLLVVYYLLTIQITIIIICQYKEYEFLRLPHNTISKFKFECWRIFFGVVPYAETIQSKTPDILLNTYVTSRLRWVRYYAQDITLLTMFHSSSFYVLLSINKASWTKSPSVWLPKSSVITTIILRLAYVKALLLFFNDDYAWAKCQFPELEYFIYRFYFFFVVSFVAYFHSLAIV